VGEGGNSRGQRRGGGEGVADGRKKVKEKRRKNLRLPFIIVGSKRSAIREKNLNTEERKDGKRKSG